MAEVLAPGRLSSIGAGDWVRLAAQQWPDRDCFILEDNTRRTFREVDDRVNRLATALADQGVERGERVALLATDSAEYVEVLLALMKLGATFVPLNFRLATSEVRTLLEAAEATWVFAGERYLSAIEEIRGDLPLLANVVTLGFTADGLPSFEDLLASGRPEEPPRRAGEEDIFGLAFTSGTTGLPKGVLQSQRMIKAMTLNGILEYRLQPGDIRYAAAPLYHVAGMGYVFMAIARGCTSLILPQFDAAVVLDWLKAGLTGVFLVPTMVSSVLQQAGIEEGDYSALRSIVYGASPMSPALLRRAMAIFDCDFYNGFGAGTEAGMQSVLGPEDHRRALAGEEHLLSSIGKPGFGIELKLTDGNGEEVPRGEVGEISTRSDMVMSGYLGRPDLTERAVTPDGWFTAGDMAWMDEDGYLYLAGRKNDMIIRGGENIYPIEIESTLAEHPTVVESAVVGAPDEHWGEVVIAYLVTDRPVEVDELAAFCRERLAKYKVPAAFFVVDELPKNASGKVLKHRLRNESER